MTAAPDDADLGLNLVFSTPSSGLASGSGGAANNNKKPKRKTKYDRRRERGRLAKLAKEEKKKQHDQQVGQQRGVSDGAGKESVGAASSLAGIAAALSGGGGSSREIKPALGAPTTTQKTSSVNAVPKTDDGASTNHEDVKEKSCNDSEPSHYDSNKKSPARPSASTPAITNDNGEDSKETARASSTDNEPSVPKTTASSSLASKGATTAQSAMVAEDPAASSRRHRAQTSLSEEQRTKYLSEFHARPRDLDRSERASRDIKASCASDHIFGEAAADDDVMDADEMDDANKEMTEKANDDTINNGEDKQPATSCPFQKLGLHSHLVSTLTSPNGQFKLSQPTIVQSRSILALLPKPTKKRTNHKKSSNKMSNQNLFIQSETGSGKTLAYLLPILQHLAIDSTTQNVKRIDRQLGGTRAILLCPTRELATQTYEVANALCNKSYPWIVPGCFSGGEKRKSEKARLRKGISILIATPGRLLDHLSKTESLLSSLKNKLEWLVLDEADRLLDAGLGGQVEQIVQHLRSNQPGAGRKRDGVTWRSVLVSATVTSELEGLAKTVLGGDGGWMWARGHAKGGTTFNQEAKKGSSEANDEDHPDSQANEHNGNELDNAAPRQLAQLYMVVSAKLRLSSLIAFLAARASKGERTVVFLSTCDSVDYHHALFTAMECILGDAKDVDDNAESAENGGGIFGKKCPIYKLHGDIPHNKRLATLKAFSGNQHSAILLATDVAARGLNFPSLDWIVQYDPPCETKDYVHRAGRSARAGQAGHALLFLLPSERQYVEVLQLRGLKEISALSLASTLTSAAEMCRGVAQEGQAKAAGNTFSDGRGEAFTTAIQNRLEQCVIQNDADYKASIEKKSKGDPKQKRRKQKKDAVGPLLEGARKAFSAFVRAYPAKEKAVRHIFNARALHLGHIARSLALKETPKMVSKGNNKSNANNIGEGSKSSTRDKAQSGKGEKRKSRLTFGSEPAAETDGGNATIEDAEQERNMSLLGDAIGRVSGGRGVPAKKKMKSSSSGGGGRDVQKRMMEAAMMMQAQEFM